MTFKRIVKGSALAALLTGAAAVMPVSAQVSPVDSIAAKYQDHGPTYRFDTGVFAGQKGAYGIEEGLSVGPVSFSVQAGNGSDRTIKNVYRALPQGVKGLGTEKETHNRFYGADIGIDESISQHMRNLPVLGGIGVMLGLEGRTFKKVAYETLLDAKNDTLDASRNEKNGREISWRVGLVSRMSATDLFYYSNKGTQIVLKLNYGPERGFGGGIGISIPLNEKK